MSRRAGTCEGRDSAGFKRLFHRGEAGFSDFKKFDQGLSAFLGAEERREERSRAIGMRWVALARAKRGQSWRTCTTV